MKIDLKKANMRLKIFININNNRKNINNNNINHNN